MSNYIHFFNDLNNEDTAEVGGKNASLGEMIGKLEPKGIRIPSGYATTAQAYRDFLEYNGLREKMVDSLKKLDKKEFKNLKQTGETLRDYILKGEFPEELAKSIKEAYRKLEIKEGNLTSVAVRSSATAEDLPDASFAGQHDSFMNIKGPENTLEACKKSENTTINKKTLLKDQKKFVLTDEEIVQLASWCLEIEEHYGRAMDIEWAKDGETGGLYIVQARPETVHSGKDKTKFKEYRLNTEGNIITTGTAIGEKITKGISRILSSPDESAKLEKGDVLVTEMTNPDWNNVMKKASAIITNSGGRTSHAAIVSRELGVVAIVGTENATETIKEGQEITVSCAGGNIGKVYEG